MTIDAHDGANIEDSDHPDHQAQLRSQWRLHDDVDLNGSLSYVDRVSDSDIPPYLRLDLGITWRPTEGIELALWGQNLTESKHAEERDEFLMGAAFDVPRGAYLQLSWEF